MEKLSQLSRSIQGRVAIVTGAASGMGRATAYLFADEGARVAAVDINAQGVQQVVKEIREAEWFGAAPPTVKLSPHPMRGLGI